MDNSQPKDPADARKRRRTPPTDAQADDKAPPAQRPRADSDSELVCRPKKSPRPRKVLIAEHPGLSKDDASQALRDAGGDLDAARKLVRKRQGGSNDDAPPPPPGDNLQPWERPDWIAQRQASADSRIAVSTFVMAVNLKLKGQGSFNPVDACDEEMWRQVHDPPGHTRMMVTRQFVHLGKDPADPMYARIIQKMVDKTRAELARA